MIPQLNFDAPWSPIQGFIGMNGGGKSALMVTNAIDQANKFGVPIWSNIWIDPEQVDQPVHRLRGLLDFEHIERAVVVLDDIASVAPARETNAAPPAIVMRLKSLRHRDAMLLWSSPVLEDVDVQIRRVTQSIVGVKALYRRRVPGQLWQNTVVSYARAYDFSSELTVTLNSDTPRKNHGFLRLGTLRLDAYNTREEMELAADHAICTVCGLRKRREYCTGKHPLESTELPAPDHVHGSTAEPAAAADPDHRHGTADAPGPLLVNG